MSEFDSHFKSFPLRKRRGDRRKRAKEEGINPEYTQKKEERSTEEVLQ